jgi:hypothetical protein
VNSLPEEVNAAATAALEAVQRIEGCSVGFLQLFDDGVEPLGSGTLVRIGNVAGIITAAHVWSIIVTKKLARVGFYHYAARRREIQSAVEEVPFLSEIAVGRNSDDALGPDIAFVKLPSMTAATLGSLGTFLNIDKHRETVAALDAKDIYRVDAVAGLVAEWDKTVTTHGKGKAVRVEGFTNIGNANKIDDGRDGFDRFEFTPQTEPGFKLPKSYGGTSGGGLFRTYLDRDRIARVALMGVAFWETTVDGKADKIICHGPESIYEKLVPMVRASC